ncbi:MAG: hypothetical protein FWG13_06710 [Leptospirales bacterium]|nr:hypothetical protein [Leptospirales bacterium]
MPTTEDFLKKYADILDPNAKACQTEPCNCTGENCTIDMCLSCSIEESCNESKAKKA